MIKNKKSIIETHGQVESPQQNKFQPTLLEQVWGTDNLSRYGTLEEDTYLKRLENMTRADLESHARQIGVVIVEHSPRLKDKLMTEFRSYASLVRKPLSALGSPDTKISDAAQRVLSEGR